MNNIKSKFLRGTQTIKRKMGKTQATTDEQYEQLYHRTTQVEGTIQNFNKHVQQLIENFHAFSATLHFLADDCRDLYFLIDRDQKELAQKLLSLAEEVENSCVLPFQESVQTNVLGPSEQHLAKFPAIKDMHKRRRNKQLDFEYMRDRVQSMASKQSSKNPMELPRAKEKLAHAKEDYESIDANAKAAMEDLLEQRTEVYDPAISSLLLDLSDYVKGVASTLQRIEQAAKHLKQTGGQRTASGLNTPSSLSGSFSNMGLNDDDTDILSMSSSSSSIKRTGSGGPPAFNPRGSGGVPPPSFNNIPIEFDCEWFYLDSNVQQLGPFGFLDMKRKYKNGEIDGQTHVFGGDMSDWAMIKDTPKFRAALES